MTDARPIDIARILEARIHAAFPAWESATPDAGGADDSRDLVIVTVPPPTQPTHRLDVVLLGHSVEVRYDDAQPPGPAEKLFVDFQHAPEAASNAVVAFLRDVTEGRVVVVRRRLGLPVRLLRGDQCESLAEFRSAREVAAAKADRFTAVFRWAD